MMVIVINCRLTFGQHASGGGGHRRQMNVMRTMAQKAFEHGLRINEEAGCSRPRAELIYLSDSNKIYLPRATLLHRCSDLTGCCTHATHSCQPVKVEQVSLYFFSISVQSISRMRQNQNIEKLTFTNHTECGCMPVDNARSDSIVKKSSDSSESVTSVNVSEPRVSMHNDGDASSTTIANHQWIDSTANNQIDIHNGGGMVTTTVDNSEAKANVLYYWGKLLGLYKAKTQRNVDEKKPGIKSSKPFQGASRRIDSLATPPSTTTTTVESKITGPLSYKNHFTFVPYQSSYVYVPSVGHRYNLGHSDLVRRHSNSYGHNGYPFTYQNY